MARSTIATAAYDFRVRFQAIFDRDWDRNRAHNALIRLFFDMLEARPELDGIIRTFERWQEPILNYFDARQTCGPVEGSTTRPGRSSSGRTG